MMDAKFAAKPITAQYTLLGRTDLDQMPDTPNRGAHHRRAQSETFFRFPDFVDDDDDVLLDDVVADFNLDFPPAPSLSSSSSDTHMQQRHNGPGQPRRPNDEPKPVGNLSHFRSLSVDADFFAGLDFGSEVAPPAEQTAVGVGPRHRHSNSMDGSFTTSSFEAVDSSKKAMAPDKLAELALMDPKRAKRILANRQSAARSKERKTRYTNELERKVQTLQTEATTLSAEVTKLQRGTTGLNAENKELKLRLQAFEQQAHLRDALNEALREELHRLKIEAGQIQAGNGNNTGLRPQFSSQPQNFNNFSGPQPQYPQQQQQQQQLHIPHSTASNTNLSVQPQPSFLGFNQRA